MAYEKGVSVLLKVNTGTDLLPVWTAVGGQRGATLNRSADTIETTSKDSTGYKSYAYGFKDWSIDADGLLVTDDAGYGELEDAFIAGTTIKVDVVMASGDKYSGDVIITDFPIEAPYDDMTTYSVTLQGSGALTKTTV